MGNQLNCIEHCRAHREQDQHLLMLQTGARFKRNKYVLGFAAGSEDINLCLSGDEQSLQWKTLGTSTTESQIDLNDIASVTAKEGARLTITAKDGRVLLDAEAETQQQRDAWVTSLEIVCDIDPKSAEDRGAAVSNSGLRKILDDRAKKQAYWAQRTQELHDREREAAERKKQFAGVGMKYTAQAMSNRFESKAANAQD